MRAYKDRNVYLGLSLGMPHQASALCALDRYSTRIGGNNLENHEVEYELRYLHRFRAGSKFTDIAIALVAISEQVAKPGPGDYQEAYVYVAVDVTGVGLEVAKLIREDLPTTTALFMTGADTATRDGFVHRVPKRDLATVLHLSLQASTLKIADDLPLRRAFIDNVMAFTPKIKLYSEIEAYEDWREGANDDLFLAVGAALWKAQQEVVELGGTNWTF